MDTSPVFSDPKSVQAVSEREHLLRTNSVLHVLTEGKCAQDRKLHPCLYFAARPPYFNQWVYYVQYVPIPIVAARKRRRIDLNVAASLVLNIDRSMKKKH